MTDTYCGWLRVRPGGQWRLVATGSEPEVSRLLDDAAAQHQLCDRWVGREGIDPRRVLRGRTK